MAFEIVEPFPGMLIGRGVDTTTGDTKASVAVVGEVGVPDGAGGSKGDFNFLQVNTASSFDAAINADVSVSYGTSIFGKSIGASAKTSYRDRCKISNQATFCVVRFVIENAFETFLETPRLSEEAFELLRLNKTERFRERFGNRFVSGRFTGAEFFATLRIESSSQERQREIAASVEANFGALKSSGSGENNKLETSSEDTIEIMAFQSGGLIKPMFSLEEILEHSENVAQQAQSGLGVPFLVTLESYKELLLPNDNLSFVEHQHAQETLRKLGKDYRQLQMLQNDIDFVLRNQSFFVNPKVKQLNDANAMIADQLNRIVEAADTCVRDVGKCELISAEIPKIDLPKRKPKKKKPTKPSQPLPGIKPNFAAGAGAAAGGRKPLLVPVLAVPQFEALAAAAIRQRAGG